MLRKKILPIVMGIVIAMMMVDPASAEQPAAGPWKVQIETGLGVTQAAYSDNWVGGEAGSLIWVSEFHGKAERQLSASWFQGNELKLAFGQSHSQDKDKKWLKPQKSADKIRYDGIFKLTKGWLIDPYASGTFESQFLDASDPQEKRYINPMEFTEGTGVARTLVNVPDKSVLNMRLGFGLKQLTREFTSPNDSTETLRETSNDGGAEWVTDLALGSAKGKYSLTSKLTVFQAFFHDKSGGDQSMPEGNEWKTADANWDNVFRANVSTYIQTSLSWQLLYDKQVSKGGRFKETLSLGLSYKFAK